MSKKTLILLLFSCLILFSFIPQGHPITISLYDTCDSLTPWTVGTFMAASISTDCMQGTGSIYFNNNTAWGGSPEALTSNMPSSPVGSKVLGCYFKISSTSSVNTGIGIDVKDTATGYLYGWGITYDGAHAAFGGYILDAGVGYGNNLAVLNPDTWYWIELSYYEPTASIGWTIDGVSKGGASTVSAAVFNTATPKFHIQKGGGYATGQWKIDYVRFTDIVEYPPSALTYPLAISALNVANGSSVSVPMKLNDAEYYTPIAASLEAGIYIIQPENIGFNSSHYWNFINWTDGADRVRTINFTGSASYTAYYRLTKIPDVGGYFNFFLGLFGLLLIGGSWFVLKWQWDEKEYAFAVSAWLSMMMIGFGLCMVMFGA